MALGGTARKIQKLADTAETLYEQSKELQQRVVNLEESVDESTQRLDRLEVEGEKQRVLIEAIAREHGINVEQVLAEAAIEEAEPIDANEATDAETDAKTEAPTEAGTSEEPAGDDAPTVVDDQGNTVE
jgi:TolA-binding protein